MEVLIDAESLGRRIAAGERIVLLDVRWKLGDPEGRRHHADAHLPGAAYVDLDTELAAAPSAAAGRHPLPSVDELQSAARRWGLRDGDEVVVYDDVGATSAARAWWLLRWAGHRPVRILDGGLGAWRAAGLPLESGPVIPPAGDVVLGGPAESTVDADGAAKLAATGVLLDARAAQRFRGEIEPVDPRAGHIPGATSAPTTDNLTADGRFRSPALLRQRLAALGVDGGVPVGVYCGSGVTAAHEIAALAVAGLDAALYPGSFSQWSNDPERAVATGS